MTEASNWRTHVAQRHSGKDAKDRDLEAAEMLRLRRTMPVQQIADQFGVSPATVYNRINALVRDIKVLSVDEHRKYLMHRYEESFAWWEAIASDTMRSPIIRMKAREKQDALLGQLRDLFGLDIKPVQPIELNGSLEHSTPEINDKIAQFKMQHESTVEAPRELPGS